MGGWPNRVSREQVAITGVVGSSGGHSDTSKRPQRSVPRVALGPFLLKAYIRTNPVAVDPETKEAAGVDLKLAGYRC